MIRNNKSKSKFNKTNKFKEYKIWRILICQKTYFIEYLCKINILMKNDKWNEQFPKQYSL